MLHRTARHTIVGLGEILWDMLPDGKKLGGAPANFAYHAQALGAKGIVVSCVGKDSLGSEIFEVLDKLGIDRSFISANRDLPTGTVTVNLDENGKPTYTIHENVAWDHIPATERLADLAASCDVVCFGSLCQRSQASRGTIRRFLDSTRPGCVRIFDVNLRKPYFNGGSLRKSLSSSTVLKLNDEELPVLAQLLGIAGGEKQVVSRLTGQYSLRMIAVTRGAGGSSLYAGGSEWHHEGYKTAVADTVGAGDAFAAALAIGILENQKPDRINRDANRLAAFVCSKPGATPVLEASLRRLMGLE